MFDNSALAGSANLLGSIAVNKTSRSPSEAVVSARERLLNSYMELSIVVDKLCGSPPEKTGGNPSPQAPSNTFGLIEYEADNIHSLVDQINNLTSRLAKKM